MKPAQHGDEHEFVGDKSSKCRRGETTQALPKACFSIGKAEKTVTRKTHDERDTKAGCVRYFWPQLGSYQQKHCHVHSGSAGADHQKPKAGAHGLHRVRGIVVDHHRRRRFDWGQG